MPIGVSGKNFFSRASAFEPEPEGLGRHFATAGGCFKHSAKQVNLMGMAHQPSIPAPMSVDPRLECCQNE